MKVAIVTHKVIKSDGQGRINAAVAREALNRGYHVTLVASDVEPTLAQHPLVHWVKIPVSRWPTAFLRNMVFSYRSHQWLQRHRATLDIIKVNGAVTHGSATVNAVHFVHSRWLRSPLHPVRYHRNAYGIYQWFYTRVNAHWEQRAFRLADRIVAVSQQVATDLQAIGVPKTKIRLIANGVDTQDFMPLALPAETAAEQAAKVRVPLRQQWNLQQQWNLPTQAPIALFVGDIRSPRKNLDTILHALTQVPTLHLAVAGTTDGSPYPALADTLGLGDRVHFLGQVTAVPRLMRAADFFVFPSRYDPFGLVVLEAMASGLPIITAQTTGASALVSSDAGIVLADPDDQKALADALRQLTHHPDHRHAMGQSARSIAEGHSLEQMAQGYLDLFETLKDPSTQDPSTQDPSTAPASTPTALETQPL